MLFGVQTKGGKGRKSGHEADGYGEEENVSTSDQRNDKHLEEASQLSDAALEHMVLPFTFQFHSFY